MYLSKTMRALLLIVATRVSEHEGAKRRYEGGRIRTSGSCSDETFRVLAGDKQEEARAEKHVLRQYEGLSFQAGYRAILFKHDLLLFFL